MKRRLLTVALLVIVGAVGTVAVAWIMLATGRLQVTAEAGDTEWPTGTPRHWPLPTDARVERAPGVRLVTRTSRAPVNRSAVSASVLECGWPWRALVSRQWAVSSEGPGPRKVVALGSGPWLGGIPVEWERIPAGAGAERRLPVQPVSWAFALDTLVLGILAGGLWNLPTGVRWLYRRRCGLCPACAYPIDTRAVCSECGRAVRPWRARAPRPSRVSPSMQRRIARGCVAAMLLSGAMYVASAWWSVYFKGPWGMYVAAWHGQFAIGRSPQAFEVVGFEASASSFSLAGAYWRSELLGKWVGLPLWWPAPVLGAIGAALWWRLAVKRGLALHWPEPEGATSDRRTSE